MKESRAKSAMGGKSSKRSGRKVREMHIRPGKSGGYLVKHDLESPSKEDMMNAMMGGDQSNQEEHSVPDLAGMQQHLAQHMPEQVADTDQDGE